MYRCILVLLFIVSVLLLLICLKRKSIFRGGKGLESRNEVEAFFPVYEKLKELDLSDKEAKETAIKIIESVLEYSDNPFIISTKMDILISRLNKDMVKTLKNDKRKIMSLMGIGDEYDKIRTPKDKESVACDLYECPRCKGRKHTYKEVQQRAIDEPTNVKCICLICGMKWDQD